MFNTSLRQTHLSAALYLAERTYHISVRKVRKVRKKHGNAVISILTGVGQTDTFTLAFYVIFAILLIRAITVRGKFFLYTMSGVFLSMAHVQTVQQYRRPKNQPPR